jgi:ABC-type nitrate/sulfonate/bicarbonate transport system ATPase subunit
VDGTKRSALSVVKRARQRLSWRASARERVDHRRVAMLLQQVGLEHCANDRPAALSGGMRQRALAHSPKIGPLS